MISGMYQPPQIKPVALDDLALPIKTAMPNGIPLYRLAGNGKGVVRFDILLRGGYAVQDKPLQAMFVNRMLREGAEGMDAEQISRKLDYYGAWIDMYSSQGCNHITLYTMSKHFLPLLEVLEAMVKRPLFPQENLDTVRRNNKSHFLVNSRKVDILSQRYFENSLWGDNHPMGHIVEAEDYDSITRDDLVSYHERFYNSGNCTLFLTGDAGMEIINAVINAFGSDCWGSGESIEAIDVPAPDTDYSLRKVDVNDSMQSAVKIGFMSLESSHPDFFKFRFLAVLLGGYFGSRLMSNVREENGYTYHIAAELDAYGRRNAFMISSECDCQYVDPLIKEVYNEIDRLVNEPIPEEEVELVRNYILGELTREYEGQFAKAEVFINAMLSGEEFESVNDYLQVVRNITAAELEEVARNYLKRDRMIEIIAGRF